MLIEDYFHRITEAIDKCNGVQSSSVTYDKRSSYVGFIRGSIWFSDSSVLHLREFVNVQHGTERYMYAYQYQNSSDAIIFRYDKYLIIYFVPF
ncbi:MAG: hypothetical protein GY749_01025 [Desulfobacteraceae bacterium]|nr:hypothetical protein [Desulfobacteraceae bacterium]